MLTTRPSRAILNFNCVAHFALRQNTCDIRQYGCVVDADKADPTVSGLPFGKSAAFIHLGYKHAQAVHAVLDGRLQIAYRKHFHVHRGLPRYIAFVNQIGGNANRRINRNAQSQCPVASPLDFAFTMSTSSPLALKRPPPEFPAYRRIVCIKFMVRPPTDVAVQRADNAVGNCAAQCAQRIADGQRKFAHD